MGKFKLTNETKVVNGITLFRIECTTDFRYAKKGEKGGWLEKETNLLNNAWVSDNARVSGNAVVSDNALVYGNARVSGDAVSTRKVLTSNSIYNLTLTDKHIKYGCYQKTIKDWVKWLKSDEVLETERNTDKFKMIKSTLKMAIKYHKYLNK